MKRRRECEVEKEGRLHRLALRGESRIKLIDSDCWMDWSSPRKYNPLQSSVATRVNIPQQYVHSRRSMYTWFVIHTPPTPTHALYKIHGSFRYTWGLSFCLLDFLWVLYWGTLIRQTQRFWPVLYMFDILITQLYSVNGVQEDYSIICIAMCNRNDPPVREIHLQSRRQAASAVANVPVPEYLCQG